MAMQIGSASGDDDVMVEINTTPLIDVMLVLLIMLIITIPIQTHAVKMNMPIGNPPPQVKQPTIIKLDVDFDGTVYWNGQALADRSSLETKLSEIATQTDQPEVHLRPNKLVKYEHVAAVLAAAQRLGVTKIGMVGNEQFMN
ncbi:MAG: biopolymer transporter ExbD [Betaproteobacteria bacterium]|jgi:biopolymer transport protein ExbD|nr:biopolymer transporter ExbD [Pseudomonadota bacterium]NBO04296.1 biopolymer transporter ExbD [Betaproteobacteria bacterium]NBO96605.1 biopolymer transporter ExbD [Betaproteobacteria bacterium]NBP34620.1 biopolymer transporter ExbD [Betaproteobacteria bacterium]NBP39811.1 biopolymer transporter ExbD [Betaproteobacteria bacterium]